MKRRNRREKRHLEARFAADVEDEERQPDENSPHAPDPADHDKCEAQHGHLLVELWNHIAGDNGECDHDERWRAYQPGRHGGFPNDEAAHDADRAAQRLWHAQSRFAHQFIHEVQQDCFEHHRKRRLAFRRRDFEQKRLRQQLRVMRRDTDVQPRQEDRKEKRDVFEPADECRVERAVRVVVDRLEILDEQVRHIDRRRRAIDQYADAPFVQLAAQRVGPFRQADALEDGRALKITCQVSRRKQIL